MKSIFLTAGMLLFSLLLKAQTDSVTISGILSGAKNDNITISFTDENGKNVSGSTKSIKDKFSVKVPAQKMPVAARLSIYRSIDPLVKVQNPSSSSNFFVWKSDLQVKGDADQLSLAIIMGDKENDAYAALVKQEAKSEMRLQQLQVKLRNKGTKLPAADSLAQEKEIRTVSMSKYERQKEFVNANPDAFASVFLLSRLGVFYIADNYLKTWNGLSETYKNTLAAESIKKELKKLTPTMAGTPVFAFERLDKDGNKVSPELLKGKTYLLDFWGSWCGPCRASHPHLKELYTKYKDKGFEIVAIAQERGKTLEDAKGTWLKAIKEDQIEWVHILNQDGIEKQNLVSTFHINAFPTKILIGADGKILLRISASATNDIDKALERIYGF